MELNGYLQNKYNLVDISIVQDKKDKYKSYVMLDGYVIAIQVDVGIKDN